MIDAWQNTLYYFYTKQQSSSFVNALMAEKERQMQETQFVPVDSGNSTNGSNGKLLVIRGGNLISGPNTKTPLEIGVVAEGRYEGAVANKYDETKLDYKVRSDDGTLIILAETAALRRQFSKVNEGELVQVSYGGKSAMTGKNRGKTFQNFTVLRAINSEE